MSHAAVDAIIFDYGKVLSLPPTPEQWNRFAARFGVDEPALQKHYWGFRDDYDRGVFNGAAYWREVAKAFHQTLTDADVEQLVYFDNDQWTNVNPEMLDFARCAQARGMRTAILSNMQQEMLAF